MALLLQTTGSLVAILALAGLAWWLKLGDAPRLDSDAAVRRAAGEVEDGFAHVTNARDAEGTAALARDAAGRIMVIKRHGNRFAGRVLEQRATAHLMATPGGTALEVDPGEVRFGKVCLTHPDAQAWVDAINRLDTLTDA